MTLTLNLRPETEAGLLADARAAGVPMEDYVERIVEQAVHRDVVSIDSAELARRQEAVQRMIEFGEKYRLSFGEPITREAMHEGHRF